MAPVTSSSVHLATAATMALRLVFNVVWAAPRNKRLEEFPSSGPPRSGGLEVRVPAPVGCYVSSICEITAREKYSF
nr:hypothetical protein CFP56_43807 [Quercus suber]